MPSSSRRNSAPFSSPCCSYRRTSERSERTTERVLPGKRSVELPAWATSSEALQEPQRNGDTFRFVAVVLLPVSAHSHDSTKKRDVFLPIACNRCKTFCNSSSRSPAHVQTQRTHTSKAERTRQAPSTQQDRERRQQRKVRPTSGYTNRVSPPFLITKHYRKLSTKPYNHSLD